MDFFKTLTDLIVGIAWPGLIAFVIWLIKDPIKDHIGKLLDRLINVETPVGKMGFSRDELILLTYRSPLEGFRGWYFSVGGS